MASSSGPRQTAVLLLEAARKNQVLFSENFGSTWWAPFNSPTLTSGQADPYGGTAAWLVTDDSTSNQELLNPPIAFDSTVAMTASLFVKVGTTQAGGGSRLKVTSTSGGGITGDFTFSSGVPAMVVSLGSSVTAPERWRDGWWRIQVKSSAANISTGTGSRFQIIPARTVGEVGNLYIFGAQLEQ